MIALAGPYSAVMVASVGAIVASNVLLFRRRPRKTLCLADIARELSKSGRAASPAFAGFSRDRRFALACGTDGAVHLALLVDRCISVRRLTPSIIAHAVPRGESAVEIGLRDFSFEPTLMEFADPEEARQCLSSLRVPPDRNG